MNFTSTYIDEIFKNVDLCGYSIVKQGFILQTYETFQRDFPENKLKSNYYLVSDNSAIIPIKDKNHFYRIIIKLWPKLKDLD